MKVQIIHVSLLVAIAGKAAGQQVLTLGQDELGPDGLFTLGAYNHNHHSQGNPSSGQPSSQGYSQQAPPQMTTTQQPAPQTTTSQRKSSSSSSSSQSNPSGQPQPPKPTTTSGQTQSFSNTGNGSPPATTNAPSGLPSGGVGGNDGCMTVDIINSVGKDVYVSYGQNAGAPGPEGNPTPGNMGHSTQVVLPTGWAGRVYVDFKPDVDPLGTKFEGSTTGAPDIDVSYVDGYNMPMTCSVNGEAITGCNLDLYAMGSCPPDQKRGDVCINPANTPEGNGPAPPFFAPCVGAAYTFPNDNVANRGNVGGSYMTCCLGTNCPAPARQGKMPNKPSKRRNVYGGSLMARNYRHANGQPGKMA